MGDEDLVEGGDAFGLDAGSPARESGLQLARTAAMHGRPFAASAVPAQHAGDSRGLRSRLRKTHAQGRYDSLISSSGALSAIRPW